MKRISILMKSLNSIGASLSAVFLLLTIFSVVSKSHADGKYTVQAVPLTVEQKIVHYEKVMPEFVEKIIATPRYAAFISSRHVWIKFPKKEPVLLSSLVMLPKGFDWYETACPFGNRLVISVGKYAEEQRQKDINTPRGGFVAGPRPVGMLLVGFEPPEAKLIDSLKVVKRRTTPDEPAPPDEIAPKFQSSFQDGKYLYIGEYGYLARIDFDSMTADILDLDVELQISRVSVWKEGSTIWYAADEGGADGTWITKLDIGGPKPKTVSQYALLNNVYTFPDSIIRYKGRLLTSSLAGIVEIDETKKKFIHYQMTREPKTMRVYKLCVLDGQLWGLREDGWVKFDLEKKKAVHYHLKGDDISNNIYSMGYFEGQLYIGTDKELIRIK